MKKTNRLLSILLTLCMFVTLVPAAAIPVRALTEAAYCKYTESSDGTASRREGGCEDDAPLSGRIDRGNGRYAASGAASFSEGATLYEQRRGDKSCGDALVWSFDEDAGKLTISGAGAMDEYESKTGRPWNAFADKIRSVVVEDGVTTVGAYAFVECGNLEQVTLGKDVAALTLSKDGYLPLYKCGKLTEITVDSKNAAFCGVDGVLYEREGGEPVRLLLCPLARTGSVTVPGTVASFAQFSFYAESADSQISFGLSEIKFAPRETSAIYLGEWDESGQKYGGLGTVFGSVDNYEENSCVLVAPEGMLLFNEEDREALKELFDYDDEISLIVFHSKDMPWSVLQRKISAANGKTLTLDRGYDYTVDSWSYEEDGETVLVGGELTIPAGTVLDLNGKTLNAHAIWTLGDFTVENGTLNGSLCVKADGESAVEDHTLTIRNATVETPAADVETNTFGALVWIGAISLRNAKLTLSASPLNCWVLPKKGSALTMDTTSELRMGVLDLSESGLNMGSLMAYLGTETEEEKITGLYQDALGAFMPAGLSFCALEMEYIYICIDRPADGEMPESVLFKLDVDLAGKWTDSDDHLTAQVNVPKGVSALLIAAAYDGGRQKDVRLIPVAADTTSYDTGFTRAGGYTCQLMLVSTDSYTPLCRAWWYGRE